MGTGRIALAAGVAVAAFIGGCAVGYALNAPWHAVVAGGNTIIFDAWTGEAFQCPDPMVHGGGCIRVIGHAP